MGSLTIIPNLIAAVRQTEKGVGECSRVTLTSKIEEPFEATTKRIKEQIIGAEETTVYKKI